MSQRLGLFILFIGLCFSSKAYNPPSDTVKIDTVHSPKKAAILSAILPSAGQFYNKKYWKMPIVYAGLGAATYFIIDNTKNFKTFRTEYLARLDTTSTDFNSALVNYSESDLRTVADTYERWRDLSYMAFGIIYAIQIIDAVVDAHFFDWDKKINEDLTLRISPYPNLSNRSLGLRLTLKL